MLEIFSYEFMQNAILASIGASICCGVVGSLVVINRLSFLAGGVSHAAYGGIGIATFFQLPLLITTVIFSIGGALIMGLLSKRNKSRADATVGVMWAAGMALGIVLIDMTPGYQGDLMSFLFGSVLTVSGKDLQLIAVLVVTVLLIVFVLFKDFVSISFEEEFARTRGIAVDWVYLLLLAIIAVTVVVTIQIVGLILVIALMTIPPMMAERHSHSLLGMMWRAVVVSLIFCIVGLCLSYLLDLSAGAAIIAVATCSYILQQGWHGLISIRS